MGNGGAPPVGALVRRPAVVVRRRVLSELHAAGFTELQPGHLAVFQWPGPEGQRPGVLAVRAGASKQAMNHLLGQLESGGHLVRTQDPADRRTRVVRLTERGWAAQRVIGRVVADLEEEWREVLGSREYTQLQSSLLELNTHLDTAPLAR